MRCLRSRLRWTGCTIYLVDRNDRWKSISISLIAQIVDSFSFFNDCDHTYVFDFQSPERCTWPVCKAESEAKSAFYDLLCLGISPFQRSNALPSAVASLSRLDTDDFSQS